MGSYKIDYYDIENCLLLAFDEVYPMGNIAAYKDIPALSYVGI